MSKWSIALALAAACLFPALALALQPDEIALVVNSKVPDGRKLAEEYAAARHIPDNRILELDLPTDEEMPFADFEQVVVPQTRYFLRSVGAGVNIKCFVTFYGVPLRIAARFNSRDDNREMESLQQSIGKAASDVIANVSSLEALAKQLNPAFKASEGHTLEDIAARAAKASTEIRTQLATIVDPTSAQDVFNKFYDNLEAIAGDAAHIQRLAAQEAAHPNKQPADPSAPTAASTSNDFKRSLQTANQLEEQRFNRDSREQLRQLISAHFGLLGYIRLLQNHLDYLQTSNTESAFDSELALVNWTHYSHVKWLNNPLCYGFHDPQARPVIMVMRLDGPNPTVVDRIIKDSILVESQGLKGQIVLDSRGLDPQTAKPADAGFAEFDQRYRALADLLREKTKMKMLFDENPDVLPPDSAQDVGLYCGWYSVRKYVPSCKFTTGAVGYHVASYEMQSIHNAGETGWVANLLNDGVDATIGPVAEPFLLAFPHPDDFFPLLLTGKLTLAEVYWTTEPTVSWNMAAIGDPLYTPFKNNPQIQPEDLPDRLKPIFHLAPTSQP